MLNNKFILIFLGLFCLAFTSCKKHDRLPELGLGNDMNPQVGVQYVKLDSTRIYNNTSGKILRSYVSIKSNLISDMGFTWSKINVYKNGYNSVYFLNPGTTIKSFLDNVVSGQVLKLEFTIVDGNGRESKKSIPYNVTIP